MAKQAPSQLNGTYMQNLAVCAGDGHCAYQHAVRYQNYTANHGQTPDEDVALIEANCRWQINSTASVQVDPPWGLDRLDGETAVGDSRYVYGSATGKGVRVYVLDTGIRITHNDFEGRRGRG